MPKRSGKRSSTSTTGPSPARRHADEVLDVMLNVHRNLQSFVLLESVLGERLVHVLELPSGSASEPPPNYESLMLGELTSLLAHLRPARVVVVCPGFFIYGPAGDELSRPGVVIVESAGHWWTRPEVRWLGSGTLEPAVPYERVTCLLRPVPPPRSLYA